MLLGICFCLCCHDGFAGEELVGEEGVALRAWLVGECLFKGVEHNHVGLCCDSIIRKASYLEGVY